MKAEEQEEIIKKVERYSGNKKKLLNKLNISYSTYYNWKKKFATAGIKGLEKYKPGPICVWNRLLDDEREKVLKISREHPELSPRLLAVKITDEEEFSVSETAVYKLLKENNLITPRPLDELPAMKEWRHKTTQPDEIWQCDATHMFVAGWGYYKYIPVLDDYSRLVLSSELKPDETGFSISDAIEVAREESIRLGHKLDPAPELLTDNGSGFISDILGGYLSVHGIKHIYGKPYHPQTQGKVERFNRTIKQKTVHLIVYCSPDELQRAIKQAVEEYNMRPHESLGNVSPNDVYAGRKEEILRRRAEKKQLTLERRKRYNLGHQGVEKWSMTRPESSNFGTA
jgi:transposase